MYDYFYGRQADQFSFYRVPKILFTEDKFWNVSTDAKLLYGILLDRMNLSAANTDSNNTEFNDTDPFFPSGFCGKEVDGTDEFRRYYQYFYDQLYMDYLKKDFPYDHDTLELILYLIVEVMCSNRKQIRIASDDKPIEIVKSSFMKLDSEHIRFVMDGFKENTTDVRNIKQYLLASIYNAPHTIGPHYDAKVRHDGATLGGRW